MIQELQDFIDHFLTHDWSEEFDKHLGDLQIVEGVADPNYNGMFYLAFGCEDCEVENFFVGKSVDDLVKLHITPALVALAKEVLSLNSALKVGMLPCIENTDAGVRQVSTHGGKLPIRVTARYLVEDVPTGETDPAGELIVDEDGNPLTRVWKGHHFFIDTFVEEVDGNNTN